MTGVVWVTGLSGSGKTTVAGAVRDRLRHNGCNPVLLDGDVLRAILPGGSGYRPADRLGLAHCYAGLARELAAQGHLVICATVSLFHQVHAWNRRNQPRYLEVWLRIPVEVPRARAGRARLYAGAAGPVVGLDVPAEFPRHPDLVLGPDKSPDEAADLVLDALEPWPLSGSQSGSRVCTAQPPG